MRGVEPPDETEAEEIMDTGNFPFDITDVAALLKLKVRHNSKGSVDADCPLCGDKRGKMNMNLSKNVFRCNYCGEYGGMIALYAKVYGISNTDAYREICDILKSKGAAPDYIIKRKELYGAIQQTAEIANVGIRHQTYSLLFSYLSLSKTHKANLTERGLTAEQIERYGFKSAPVFGNTNLVRSLLGQGCELEGVPGFYQNEQDEWQMKFNPKCSGIIIPVTTLEGYIAGAQIRLDQPFNGKKYLWFSSANEKMGTSPGSPIGFAGDPAAETVYVTEGYLKAVIAHSLSGKSFVGVAGANCCGNIANLFAAFKQNGTKNIAECYDMDKYENEYVEKGCKRIYETAKAFGLKAYRIKWNNQYKGIDDYLYAMKKSKKQMN